jgi:CelD/BcsL family acetyltransferase involved in cellulose biosynthesis
VKVEIVQGSALSGELVDLWDSLLDANPRLDSPYFRPEFTQLVSEVRDDVQVAYIDYGEGVALFPFQRGPLGLGLPVGGLVSDFHGLVCAKRFDFDPRELLSKCGLQAWRFDHLLPTPGAFTPFQNQLRDSFYIDLGRGFDQYIRDLRKKSRTRVANIERKARNIERDLGSLRFELHTNQHSAFDSLLRWKSCQYVNTGTVDVFRYKWVVSLIHKIVCRAGSKFSGILSTLYAGDRLVAVHAGMRCSGVAHYWLPTFDRDVASYSPGIILLFHLARALADQGVHRLDLGPGTERYKMLFNNGSLVLAAGTVDRYVITQSIRRHLQGCLDFIRNAGASKILPGPARRFYNIRRRIMFK